VLIASARKQQFNIENITALKKENFRENKGIEI